MSSSIQRLTALLAATALAAAADASAAPLERTAIGPSHAESVGWAVRVLDSEQIEPEIAAAVNALRRRHGLRPLATSRRLGQAGDDHAWVLALAGKFTHDWPDGRPFVQWIPGYYPFGRYRSWRAGENLLWSTGDITPELVVRLWLASPPHRAVLLTPAWRELGVGVVRAERAIGVYASQDVYVVAAEFGARR